MREVKVFGPEGPVAQDLPHDLVGLRAPSLARDCEEHELHLGRLVQLEYQEYFEPRTESARAHVALDDVPPMRETV
eukprot:8541602-Pyramimonas_sp.AAC.1